MPVTELWIWAFAGWWLIALGFHLLTPLLALWHFGRRQITSPISTPVSIVVPMRGFDPELKRNVEALFTQQGLTFEVLASFADSSDPAVETVRAIMAAHAQIPSEVHVGDVKLGRNPKVQNLLRIYDLARHDLVLMIDSNVQLAPHAVAAMAARFKPGIGLVSAVTFAVRPQNFVAELECAMLNGHGARWQAAAAAIGIGVAVGKILFLRKSDLDRVGGLRAAAQHPCEDRAIDCLLRKLSLGVAIAGAPVESPIGARRFRDFWSRHQRYFWCRRDFSRFGFYVEPFMAGAAATIAGTIFWTAHLGIVAGLWAAASTIAIWLAVEALFLTAVRCPWSWQSPLAWLVRECLLPVLWLRAATARSLRWQDTKMEALTS